MEGADLLAFHFGEPKWVYYTSGAATWRVVVSICAPRARLIRSMKRCDRKVLPLLDKWAAVDIVMTKYEIVHFAAGDADDIAHFVNAFTQNP